MRVRVQQVGGAVQGHDGLACPRAAVDDERPTRAGTQDGVLVGLDGREHVGHPAGACAAETRDERGLVVEGGVALEALGDEDLVPVVGDPARVQR